MPPAGVENTIPESEMPQTHSFDRSATGIGDPFLLLWKKTDAISCLKSIRINIHFKFNNTTGEPLKSEE
jgi:hypothetical protein